MKNVSAERRRYMLRVNEKRSYRAWYSKCKQARARGAEIETGTRAGRKSKKHIPPLRVVAPELFILEGDKNRRPIMKMIGTIRQHVIVHGRRVQIDFSMTRKMFPCGTLLFMAEIDRLRHLTGKKLVRATYPADRVVAQVLQQVGISRILGLPERSLPSELHETVKHWRYASGELADGEAVEPIVSHYEGVLAESLKTDLYDGIVEAMTNCVQHAYPSDAPDRRPASGHRACRRWWMFSQEKDGQLTVAFCDLGIGIPTSMSESKKWSNQFLDALLATAGKLRSSNASVIKLAAELKKTRTKEGHRGKGLGEIIDVVRKREKGYLKIMSDHGVYRLDAGGSVSLRDHGASIMGTLVQWTIPLDAENDK